MIPRETVFQTLSLFKNITPKAEADSDIWRSNRGIHSQHKQLKDKILEEYI